MTSYSSHLTLFDLWSYVSTTFLHPQLDFRSLWQVWGELCIQKLVASLLHGRERCTKHLNIHQTCLHSWMLIHNILNLKKSNGSLIYLQTGAQPRWRIGRRKRSARRKMMLEATLSNHRTFGEILTDVLTIPQRFS